MLSMTAHWLGWAALPQNSTMAGVEGVVAEHAKAAEAEDVWTHSNCYSLAELVCRPWRLQQALLPTGAAVGAGSFAFPVHRQRAATKVGPQGWSRGLVAAAGEGGKHLPRLFGSLTSGALTR